MSSTESPAQKAIKENLGILNRVLNSEAVFRQVAQKCVERRLITVDELTQLNDRFSGQALQARVEAFVLRVAVLLGDLPENIDGFLSIIKEIDTLIAEKAANTISQSYAKYGYNLPKYESPGGSVPAVVSDSAVGPSPIANSTNAGSAQSSSPQQEKEEVTSDAWVVQEDLTAEEIKKKVGGIAAGSVTKKHDSFICCILSHGNPKGIEGVDGETVTVPELAKSVISKECSALRGKPKIFFFQACRGTKVPEPIAADSSVPLPPNKEEKMVADGFRALPPEADFLIGFSTSDGNVATRGVETGSQYIKALCKFLDPKYSSRFSLDELLLLVNYEVSGNPIDYEMSYKYHQMPEIRSTLRGKFYFKK
ncbi:PREDICTED: caspase-3-like [Amphimedon queenslandica]|uniref:Caspase-8 n=1 Tax=Amphimedon queenslandica TaxID=400682 RepID=A0AAN0JC68_AMPQE|nr:PREDICTED: caspase-3-like [Amphimedon queenslandica]|eukprot:XP_019854615.1 PREDICTED: caspase-3-like [Amphimedon queenslandica]